ncbi:CvpA family protein [Ramlibacter sp. H39-3-26]|uniref:CvpA family protein n=1 Tax=Curvibacter soli TaxID=3031331 RepID=UPI0023D9B59A|nr:CvpA family protein [Ramlibacter sp. H39-3-26]MDF1485254.1 CvpA family protein [Ramlibacter sp. H39-3-26]
MSALDWVFVAVLLASMLVGAWRGLVYEVLSVLGWVVAFVAAQWLAPRVAEWLPMAEFDETLRHAAGFVLAFVAVLFACGFLAWVGKRLMEVIGLRPVDRTLGAAFGILRGVVLLLAATVLAQMTPLHASAWWRESKGAPVLAAALKSLKPALPEEFGRHLPS